MATVDEILARQAYAAGDDIWTEDSSYPSYRLYVEPEYVPVTNKRIADFNDQVSVSGEQNAQFVGFQLPRYDDGIDLRTQNLYIHYQTAFGGSDSVPCNVSWSDNYVRICWMVPAQATQEPDRVQMMIYATGTNSAGDRVIWKTLPASYTIHDGLEIGGGIPKPDTSWYEQFVQQMEGKVSTAQGYADDAQASRTEAAGSAKAAAESATASAKALEDNKNYVESQKETFVGYNKRDTDLRYANALVGSASGTGRVSVGDAWEAPIPGMDISGRSEQMVTTGAQLFDINDKASRYPSFSDGVTVDDEGWVTVLGSNTGNSSVTKYFLTNPSLNLQPGTEYLCVFEIADNPFNTRVTYVDGNTDVLQGQFTQTLSADVSKASILTSRVDFSNCNSCMRGSLEIPANTLNYTITFRISLIADITKTLENFVYEPYTGGKPSPSPEYPQPIKGTGTVSTGANLCEIRLPARTKDGLTYTPNSDGSFSIVGTNTSGETRTFRINQSTDGGTDNLKDYADGQYTLSITTDSDISNVELDLLQNNTWKAFIQTAWGQKSKTANITNATDCFVVVAIKGSATVNVTGKVQLERGPLTSWEPYTGGKPSPSPEYPQPLDIITQNKNMVGLLLPGTVDMNGIEIDMANAIRSGFIKIDLGKTYTFSRKKTFSGTLDTCMARIFNSDKVFLGSMTIFGTTDLVKTIADGFQYVGASYIRLVQFKSTGDNFDGLNLQMEEGNSATDYVSPISQTATITLTKPLRGIGDYRDRIMCRDGVWGIEKKFIPLTFNGNENWGKSGTNDANKFRFRNVENKSTIKAEETSKTPIKILCTRLKAGSSSDTYIPVECISSSTSGDIYLYLNQFSSGDVDAFKAYLASNPISALFERATPAWEPLPSATQSALNALTTYTGTTHVTITAGGPEPDVGLEYVMDTRAVIADLQAQIDAIRNGGTT